VIFGASLWCWSGATLAAHPDDIKLASSYVRQSLAEALAGKPVSASVTRPYGCSIKYMT